MKDATFSAAQLLELYERISDAEDAIPRLRSFVLDLAVRGKLVAQLSAEGSACPLLLRAEAVKVQEGVKHKAVPINEEDIPFPAPTGWVWSRIGEIALQTGSGSTPRGGKSAYAEKGTPFLRSQNVYDDGLRLNDVVFINDETNEKMKRTRVIAKDLLLNITGGSIGRCCRIPDEFDGANVSQHVAIIRTAVHGTEDYLHLLVRSPFFQKYIMGEQTGAGREGLPKKRMDRIPIPLPPLAEQHRIVAKVDELMALCDQLEQARAAREAVRDRLTTASLARLTAPETDADTFQSHARFALQSLTTLTTRPDQIKTLRQTILNLAVRGKLVAQDGADEPAEEVFKRIQEWQKLSIAQKKIRAPRKPLADVNEDDHPYQLPTGWAFARLGQIIYIQSGDGLTAANMKDGPYPVFGGNGINGHHDCYNVEKPTLVIGRVGYYCGSVHVTPENAWVTDNAFITHFSEEEILQNFLVLLLNGTNLKEDENATAQPVISGSKIYPIVVGLPPLAEQHRIVAKVDALMALCDQLEASLTTTTTTRSKLLIALLHEALEPATETADA